ncbi:GNAT family N-acetyltransferase [Nocardioides marmorisolisilvae]|uniref:N-acetyltransferase n=1 Tax=Nocardioides marmorisolisilvae TaxID=1542737 RepID=A0A3N0DXY5_9ACTN|nr:GNAT family protein [Nocardioides marmorisolisilvae]RNL80478.1 N-acetyltransferase [Nocardioides marmorisolisilvae]
MPSEEPRRNEFGQTIGRPVTWTVRPAVVPVTLVGEHVRLEPWGPRFLEDLYASTVTGSPASTWTYLATPPLDSPDGLGQWLDGLDADPGAVPLVLCRPDGRAVGTASYLRLDHLNGSVEVGAIAYAAELQRTTAATEAMYLMMRHAFDDLGYRRYEWKCDSMNAPSRRAAQRLGFTYEGTFRNALVYKGRNRDTDWFSITDDEWPAVRSALEGWLAPDNQPGGTQERSLEQFRA